MNINSHHEAYAYLKYSAEKLLGTCNNIFGSRLEESLWWSIKYHGDWTKSCPELNQNILKYLGWIEDEIPTIVRQLGRMQQDINNWKRFIETQKVNFRIEDYSGSEVDVQKSECGTWQILKYDFVIDEFDTEEQAREFCEKHDLKVIDWNERLNQYIEDDD